MDPRPWPNSSFVALTTLAGSALEAEVTATVAVLRQARPCSPPPTATRLAPTTTSRPHARASAPSARSRPRSATTFRRRRRIRAAVGAAVGRNPISIVVPCHRVIGSDGTLTGYAGGLPRKEALLRHERALAATLFDDAVAAA